MKKGLTNEGLCSIIGKYETKRTNAALAQLDRVFGYEPKGRGFESLTPCQIRTQNRIQEIVSILRFLLPFRGIFALLRHKKHIFDRRSPSSERFCTFGGWAFLFALNLWVIVKIMVIVKIIVCGR